MGARVTDNAIPGPPARGRAAGAGLALCLVHGALAVWLSFQCPYAGTHRDFSDTIARAESLDFGKGAPWVDGLYPLGHHGLLRVLATTTGSYRLAGRAIAVASGVGYLWASFAAAYALSGSTAVALLTQGFLIVNFVVLHESVAPGTDMPAAAAQVAALALLLAPRLTWPRVAGAGAFLGLGYLFRYQTLFALAPVVLWLLLLPGRPIGRRVAETVVLLAGFVLATAPQLGCSAWVTGSPFYNTQATNLWIAIQMDCKFGGAANRIPQGLSLLRAAWSAPGPLLHHWVEQIASTTQLRLVVSPLRHLAYGGLLWCACSDRSSVRRPGLWLALLVLASTVASTSLFWASERFLLTAIPFLTVAGVCLIDGVVRNNTGRRMLFAVVLLLATCTTVLNPDLSSDLVTPLEQRTVSLSYALHRAGMASPREVLSTDDSLLDSESPTLERFPWVDIEKAHLDGPDALAGYMRRHGYRFAIFDERTIQRAAGLRELLLDAKAQGPWELVFHIPHVPRWIVYRLDGAGPSRK